MAKAKPAVALVADREGKRPWDLIPDERAPGRAIIMRFASFEAAHNALTEVGFTPTSGSVRLQPQDNARIALRYAHSDGSTVVLAHQLL